MKHLLFLILFLLISSLYTFSQGRIVLKEGDFNYDKNIDISVWGRLSQSTYFQQLDSSLQWNYYWLNLMRKSPASFFRTYVKNFLIQFQDAVSVYSNSLENDMTAHDSLPFLKPDQPLARMAFEYGSDMSNNNLSLNHRNSRGEDFANRISAVTGLKCAAENAYKGAPDPLLALILLLIDNNVTNLGHRKNLLDPNFNAAGLSFFKKGQENSILVQEFGCR